MNIFKKIGLANRTLSVISGMKEIAASNKDHAEAIKKGFDLIKQGADILVAELPFLKPLYNDIVEVLKGC